MVDGSYVAESPGGPGVGRGWRSVEEPVERAGELWASRQT